MVDVKRGKFQVDSFLLLLFALSIVPLLLILTEVNASYEWRKKDHKLNHLLFMNDLKLFSRTGEQINTLIREEENSLDFMVSILKLTSSGELLQLRQSILKIL